MSATDLLRELLDERGVEWEDDENVTRFFGPDGFEVVMQEDIDGKLDCLTPLYLTPEQAIAATLGAGTCRDIALEGEWFECSECRTVKQLIHPNYCPNCGRKVVDE